MTESIRLANCLIINGPNVDASKMKTALTAKNKTLRSEDVSRIVTAYVVMGEISLIGNLMPFAQAIHETGWFTSRRWLENYNPAGIGATNDGAEGGKWLTPEAGIFAQYAHLLAYAVKPTASYAGVMISQLQYLAKCSPRYTTLERLNLLGIATKWVDLNGRWAYPGKTYAQAIAKIAEFIVNVN
jgi:N-acetylmuramoyl-L-alanine amidase